MFHQIQCPSCFETFEISGPRVEECPAEWDYDCEICCRPMIVVFDLDENDDVAAFARGINE